MSRGIRLRARLLVLVQLLQSLDRCFIAFFRSDHAANLLGMKRTTLQARMRKLAIRRPV